MIFQNHYNTELFPRQYEHNTMPDLTVPDQSLTVKEIMVRHAQGLPLTGQKVPSYSEEEIIDFNRLDISERYDYVEMNRDRIALMQKDLQEQQKKTREEQIKKLEQIDIEFEDIPEEKNPGQKNPGKKLPGKKPDRRQANEEEDAS